MPALPNHPDQNNRDLESDPPGDSEIESHIRTLVAAMADIADQERQRVSVQREVAMRTLDVAENSEQLQYDLSIKQIESTDNQHRRRYGLARLIVIILSIAGIVFLAVIAAVVAMVFFGDEAQRQVALTMLGYGFAAIGGGGIGIVGVFSIYAVSRWWQGM